MENFDKEDSQESASDRSIHHPAAEGVDEIDLNVSPEHHAFGDEGKRSPSSKKGDDVGFPSFRIGEGRRSPSPVSLSKSEQDETRSSSPSPVSLSKSEQGEIESSSPTLFSGSKSEQGEILSSSQGHEGSTSLSAHDFEQAVHEQKTHDMICPVCGSDVTKRIILKRKRKLVSDDDESDDEAWGCLGCLSLFRRSRELNLSETDDPQAPGAAEVKRSWNCLPELLPAFTWGPIPVYDVEFSLDNEDNISAAKGEIPESIPVGSGHIAPEPPEIGVTEEVHQVTEHVSSEATKESRLQEPLVPPGSDQGVEPPAPEPGSSLTEEQPLPGTGRDISPAPLPGTTPPKPDPGQFVIPIDPDEPGQSPSESVGTSQEYLKSIVHGGLDVTLVSLGVVASGAGGDAKTITVVAIGLANLVFGLITHLGTIMSLYYNNRPKFVEDIGQGFVQGCLSFISLFFGALAPITYGFSFRNATNRDYKFASTCVVALVRIVLLGAAQAHVKSKSAVRVISLLIVTGFVAVTAGYETGNYVSQLLKYFEFDSV